MKGLLALMKGLFLLSGLLCCVRPQTLTLSSGSKVVTLVAEGKIAEGFEAGAHCDCGMPELFVLGDEEHGNYSLSS